MLTHHCQNNEIQRQSENLESMKKSVTYVQEKRTPIKIMSDFS